MTTELILLVWAIVLGLVHSIATGQFATAQLGMAYGLGSRDEPRKLTGVGARVERAFANYMQTFPFFAAAVLIAHVAGREGALTTTGATLYLLGRLAYVPLYAAGIPVVRTVAYVVATLGVVLILIALA